MKLGNPNGARCLQGLGNDAAVRAVKAGADKRATMLKPILEDIQSGGITSVRGMAEELNARGILTARGGDWHPTSVVRLLDRLRTT